MFVESHMIVIQINLKVYGMHVFYNFLLLPVAKLVPLAYGIHKLQITCVIEDDKVGTDLLEERITAFEDLVCFPILMLAVLEIRNKWWLDKCPITHCRSDNLNVFWAYK